MEKELIRVVSREEIDEPTVRELLASRAEVPVCAVPLSKPTIAQLGGIFAVVIGLGILFSRLGWLSPEVAIGGGIGFGAVFVMGLVAASSSCLAVAGGLMLSMVTTYRRRGPVVQFVFGRLVSYGVLGGVIGLVGQVLIPSSTVLGVITLAAALYMFVTGLNMLEITPVWLKRIFPTVPKAITYKILSAEGKTGGLMPFALGAATFFLPCGFTQALQIYALTTGSFTTSAMLLFGFALGTTPGLLLLGFASSSLKGRAGQWFYRFAGALIVVLGVINFGNGFTILGVNLPSISFGASTIGDQPEVVDSNVVNDGKTQRIKIALSSDAPYYLPSDEYTVKAGESVTLEISGDAGGCRSIFQIPGANVSLPLTQSVTTVEFTPEKPGDLVFSCSMGMYRGTLHVI